MLEIKLTHLPSGEKLGLLALPTRAMRDTAVATSLFCLSAAGACAFSAACAARAVGRQNARVAVINVLTMLISLLCIGRMDRVFNYQFLAVSAILAIQSASISPSCMFSPIPRCVLPFRSPDHGD